MKSKLDNSPNTKDKSFRENKAVKEEEWFSNINLTYSATFPKSLLKRAKSRFNKNNFPRDTKQHICTIAIKYWKPQIVQILREERDGMFHFKGYILSRLPKHTQLSNTWVLANFKHQEPAFMIDYLMSLMKIILKSLQVLQIMV